MRIQGRRVDKCRALLEAASEIRHLTGINIIDTRKGRAFHECPLEVCRCRRIHPRNTRHRLAQIEGLLPICDTAGVYNLNLICRKGCAVVESLLKVRARGNIYGRHRNEGPAVRECLHHVGRLREIHRRNGRQMVALTEHAVQSGAL